VSNLTVALDAELIKRSRVRAIAQPACCPAPRQSMPLSPIEKSVYSFSMDSDASTAIPVSPDVAARFATLTTEQKRIVRMRVAVEIGRLSKQESRAQSVAEFRAATTAIGNRARRKGLTLTKLARMLDASR